MALFDEDTPRWVRLTILGLAAALVGLVAVVVVLVVGIGGEDDPAVDPGGDETTRSSSTSVCGLPDGEQSIPTEAPEAVWETVNGVGVPSNPDLGPGLVSDGGSKRSCFAHSPLGAVFFMSSAGATAGASEGEAELVAFQVLDYTASRASVELVARDPSDPTAQLVSVIGAAEWSDGDWHLANPEDPFTARALSGLTEGHVEFASEVG